MILSRFARSANVQIWLLGSGSRKMYRIFSSINIKNLNPNAGALEKSASASDNPSRNSLTNFKEENPQA